MNTQSTRATVPPQQSRRSPGTPQAAERRRKNQRTAVLRAVIAIALLILWSIGAMTGMLLYLLPKGSHAGHVVVVLLSRSQWGEVHFWICLSAVLVTMAHVAIDWRPLMGSLRCLRRSLSPTPSCDDPDG
jgi:hypothetical protein